MTISAPTDMAELVANLLRWKESPLKFVRETMGAKPTKQQIKFLEAVAPEGSKVTVRSGHGVGKTSALAWIILWALICYDNVKMLCTAPTRDQLLVALWPEIRKWIGRLPEWLQIQVEWKHETVTIKDCPNRLARARTARKENAEAFQGAHEDVAFLIADEASGIEEAIFQAARGTLSTPGARAIFTGNPTRNTGYFHFTHTDPKNVGRWTRLHFSSLDSPRVQPAFIEDIRNEYGDDSDMWRIRVTGDFPIQEVCQLIPRALAEEAATRKLKPEVYDFAPKILSCDVAWEGDDLSVLLLRQGLLAQVLFAWRTINLQTLASIIAQQEDALRTDATFIDAGAMGPGVIDCLRALGRNPIPVYFGNPSTKPAYTNKRTEMWFDLKAWLQAGGAIPPSVAVHSSSGPGEANVHRFVDDLAGPQYFFQPNGKIGLERKKDMKSRGLASPDFADALAMTFYMPVELRMEPASPLGRVAGRGQTAMANAEYDVLEMAGSGYDPLDMRG